MRKILRSFVEEKRAFVDPFKLPRRIRNIRQKVREWASEVVKPRVRELENTEEFPWDIVRSGAEIGLLTDLIPEVMGGSGRALDFVRYGILHGAVVIEELARVCPGVAVIFGAHMLGMLPVMLSCDFKIARRVFRRVKEEAKSEKPLLFAFAITEPTAGSDVEDTESGRKAKLVTYTRRENGKYILNGRKVFISNGSVAGLVSVFAAADREKGIDSWTCFIVEKGQPGFSVARVEDKMGQRAAPAAELVFEDVEVEEKNRVGEEGEGWALNLLTLDTSRPPVGLIALGSAWHALDEAVKYAERRDLMKYRDVQYFLADLYMKLEAARTVIWRACRTFPPVPWISAMAKCVGSDTAVEIVSKVIDFMGEEGLSVARTVEKAFRDVKLTQIYEGTNQMQRLRFAEDYFQREKNSGDLHF